MAFETERWPFVKAKCFRDIPTSEHRAVRVIVVHDMEVPETTSTAEDVARYFATMPDGRVASAHVCVDCDSTVQCVLDSDVAYGAPGCNGDGIQVELAGFMRQSRAEWLDDYGQKLLARGADVVAQYCLKYGIPPVQLTNDELKAGKKGVVGHVQVSAVYKKSDHQDPGPNFPWDIFMELVANAHRARSGE